MVGGVWGVVRIERLKFVSQMSLFENSYLSLYLYLYLYLEKTSQELRMLSSVTLDCQVTKIVMNSGSQL